MNAITRTERALFDAPNVTFTLDGREITASSTDTLIEIADREGVEIPRLCYTPGMDAVGNCRSCMVEIKGERVLAASCCRVPVDGHAGDDQQRAGAQGAAAGDRTSAIRHAGEGVHAAQRGR